MRWLFFLHAVVLFAACGRTFQQRTARYAEVRELHEGRAAVRNAADTSGRWGFVDTEGRLVIECRYAEVGDFSEGRAPAQLPGSMFGYLAPDGSWAIQPSYARAGAFANGRAWVMNNNGLFGRIDVSGRWGIPCLYDEMPTAYVGGLLLVLADGRWGLLSETGEVVAPCVYEQLGEPDERGWIAVQRDGKWGWLDLTGQEVVSCKYEEVGQHDANGLMRVSADGKYGFLGQNGKEIVPCNFRYISDFEGGYAQVNIGGSVLPDGRFSGGQWGLIDSLGREQIPCKYDFLGELSDGVVAFRTDASSNFGYLDLKGRPVLAPRYAVAHPFSGGVAVVSYNKVDFGMIDINGNEQSSFRYKQLGKFRDGLVPFNLNPSGAIFQGMVRRCGYLDHQGREVIPARYDDAREFSELRAAVLRYGVSQEDFFDARWGYITPSGELIVDYKYHEAHPFNCGLARVFIKGQGYGFIDRQGREVVPCMYPEAGDYHEFSVHVRTGDGRNLILDDKGQVVSGG